MSQKHPQPDRHAMECDVIRSPASRLLGWKDGLFVLGLLVALFLVYQPAWHGGFIWDDDAHLTRPELRSLDGLRRIWCDIRATQQYYPLLHSAFWLEHRLWGDAALGYHLLNVALHAVAAFLVLLVLRRLQVPGAYLAAAIFALHPVQVESVAWITEQKNTLSAVFYLAAMLSYLRFDRAGGKAWYTLGLLLFVLGLLSKTVTATLPAALLVIFWWQRGRLSWKRDVLPLLPFFVLGAACGVFTAWVERKLMGAEGGAFTLTVVERALIAGRAIWFYLGKLFWPADLVFIYPRWQVRQGLWWQYLFPLAAAVLLLVLWKLRRRTRAPLAAVLFFVGTLFPVLGFFNLFPFIYSFVADHFQYLANLGMIALVSAGAALLLKRAAGWKRAIGHAGCLALVAVLAVLSWRQSRMYADAETLYQTTIARNPDCWMAHNNLGAALAGRGRFDEAIAHYQKALTIKPDHTATHVNWGTALSDVGRLNEAIDRYQQALRIKPYEAAAHYGLGRVLAGRGQAGEAIAHFRKALEIKPDDAEVHNDLGHALASLGQVDEAIAHFNVALEIKPDYSVAHNNLGNALAGRGKIDEAITQYQKALEIKPDNAEAHYNLGAVLAGRGQLSGAIVHYQKALEIRPNFELAHNNLGLALADCGQVDAAIAHYQKALEIKPNFALAHNNLGLALASRGQVDAAIAHYQKALEIKPDCEIAHNNLGNVLAGRGQVDAAIAHYQKALEIKPNFENARRNLDTVRAYRERVVTALAERRELLRSRPNDATLLNDIAWLLATNPNAAVRNGPEAVELARRAVALSGGKSPEVLGTLAAAYAEAGLYADAVENARRAISLSERQDNGALADRIRDRLKLYESRTPYREPP